MTRFHFNLQPALGTPLSLTQLHQRQTSLGAEKHTLCNSGRGAKDFAPNLLQLLEILGKVARLNL